MKRLNKKGFTLVELLAVIVVLAIIMVIATQAIGNVIKKNTVNSYKSSLDMVTKQAKQAYVMEGTSITLGDVRTLVDYDPGQYEIYFGSAVNVVDDTGTNASVPGTNIYICIKPNGTDSKFNNMDGSILEDVFGSGQFDTATQAACKDFTK